MNVKIDGKGLRFKITAEELLQLQQGECVQENLAIGYRELSVVINPNSANDDLLPVYDEDTIWLMLSPKKLRELSDMGRSREGLKKKIKSVNVSLQVDFRTQKKKRV